LNSAMFPENLKHENELWGRGVGLIAGVDEVGRGCLAGPMVVGAVILDKSHLHDVTRDPRFNDVLSEELAEYSQIKDSKLLTPKKRKVLSDFITKNAVSYSIDIIEPNILDQKGISACTQIGFLKVVLKLKKAPHHVLTDTFEIKELAAHTQTNLLRGDMISITVSAASIVAKVFRDELMIKLHEDRDDYKKYSFDQHKGYGTKRHIKAIFDHGICDIHRKSFEPIKSWFA